MPPLSVDMRTRISDLSFRSIAGALRRLCLGAAFLALAGQAALGAPSDLRFSVALDAAGRAAAGLARLNSDQVAVIDALVRRDSARFAPLNAGTPPSQEPTAAPTFSGRLTADERRTAGLEALSAGEVAQLDAAVDRFQSARLARTLLAPPSFAAPRSSLVAAERRQEREIHGSFSLSFGFGRGGYREKTGAMTLHFEDPGKGYAIAISYAETHTKGGLPTYLLRDSRPDLVEAPPSR